MCDICPGNTNQICILWNKLNTDQKNKEILSIYKQASLLHSKSLSMKTILTLAALISLVLPFSSTLAMDNQELTTEMLSNQEGKPVFNNDINKIIFVLGHL